MIQVEHLTKRYGPFTAVEDATFEVGKGEVLGFLGPNGAGKTTVMRVLTGYMPPSEGVVKVAGFDVFEQSLEVRRRIGYLPETVPLYPEMSIRGYLEYIASLRHVSDKSDKVDWALDKVQLADKADRAIRKLSKGMRQRVGIAQAILHTPEVLILDEPTIGLDPSQIVEVRNLIKELGKEHTIILSTHILSEVEQTCSRVLIINKGRLVAEDTPEQLLKRMKGGERIHLVTLNPPDDAALQLGRINGVSRVKPSENGAFEIESDLGGEPRLAIAELAVRSGWGLIELRPVAVSLEEIFMQLTTE
jgi:ABC-2 type transport system ATP-binding protein